MSSTPRGQLPGWIEAARPAQLGEVDGSANWYELAGDVATADEAGLRAVPTIGARALHPTTTDTRSIAAHDQPDRPSHPDAGRTLEVAEDRRCDHALMTICGELTVDGVGTITRALNELLLGHGNVVVDLSHLRVGWVPATQVFPSTLAAAGGWPFARLVLFGATANVAQLLYAVGVTDTVPLAATGAPFARLCCTGARRISARASGSSRQWPIGGESSRTPTARPSGPTFLHAMRSTTHREQRRRASVNFTVS